MTPPPPPTATSAAASNRASAAFCRRRRCVRWSDTPPSSRIVSHPPRTRPGEPSAPLLERGEHHDVARALGAPRVARGSELGAQRVELRMGAGSRDRARVEEKSRRATLALALEILRWRRRLCLVSMHTTINVPSAALLSANLSVVLQHIASVTYRSRWHLGVRLHDELLDVTDRRLRHRLHHEQFSLDIYVYMHLPGWGRGTARG